MTYKMGLEEVERNDGDVEQINISISRDNFDKLVENVRDILSESFSDKSEGIYVNIVREGKRNPMIKIGEKDKIYFQFDPPDTYIRTTLARETVASKIISHIKLQGEGETFDESKEGRSEEEYDTPNNTGVEESNNANKGNSIYEIDDEIVDNGNSKRSSSGNGCITYGGGTNSKGSVTFTPPFTKSDASYHKPSEGGEVNLDCKDCAHYLDEGVCKMVQGEVDEDGYCDDLYADFGVYGRREGNSMSSTLCVMGDRFSERVKVINIDNGVSSLKEALEENANE